MLITRKCLVLHGWENFQLACESLRCDCLEGVTPNSFLDHTLVCNLDEKLMHEYGSNFLGFRASMEVKPILE